MLGNKRTDINAMKNCSNNFPAYDTDGKYYCPTQSILNKNKISRLVEASEVNNEIADGVVLPRNNPSDTNTGTDIIECQRLRKALKKGAECQCEGNLLIESGRKWARKKIEESEVQKLLKQDDIVSSHVNNPKKLKQINQFLLIEMNPQACAKELINQLQLHQELHLLYESNKLTKNMLSVYLIMTYTFRMDILSWMGDLLSSDWSSD